MDGSTALAVLGLEPGATKQQIKATFRALVKGAHPDAFGVSSLDTTADSVEAFVELRAAYEAALVDAPEDSAAATAAPVSGAIAGSERSVVTPSFLAHSTAHFTTDVGPAADVAPSLSDTGAGRSHRSGAWFTSSRPATKIDISDVALAGTRSLRSAMVGGAKPSADPAEQRFASLLADELANA